MLTSHRWSLSTPCSKWATCSSRLRSKPSTPKWKLERQLGAVIGTQPVNDLPLNGRNFTALLELTPGITPISTGQNSSAGNVAIVATSAENSYSFPSINGAYNRSTMYETDGMINNNSWYNEYAISPIVDTIQEFKINSHSDAQYGGVIGGVVNVATKAGTNNVSRQRMGVPAHQQFRRKAVHRRASLVPPGHLRRTDGRPRR